MSMKVFAEKGRVQLVGDHRDIAIESNSRQDVWDWCQANGIELEYHGTLAHTDLWRVRDEQQRAWFLLKWL